MRLSDFRKFMIMFVLVVALTFVVQAASPKDAFVQDVAFSSSWPVSRGQNHRE